MFGVVCPAVIVGTGGLRVRSSTLLRLEGLEEDSATKLGHWAQDSHLMLPVLRQVSVGRILMDRDVVLGLNVGQGTSRVK